jgi:hypothetical protein
MYRLSCGELDLVIHVPDEYAERSGRYSESPPGCQSDRWRARGNLLMRAFGRRWLNMELECEKWRIGTLVASRTIQRENSKRDIRLSAVTPVCCGDALDGGQPLPEQLRGASELVPR